jgi:hypothetical protein
MQRKHRLSREEIDAPLDRARAQRSKPCRTVSGHSSGDLTMQIKEQRRLPDIISGPGEKWCDLCGHVHCDLCGHVHQHGEAIASFSAAFQICQECLEQLMDGDVDVILEALIEMIEETVDSGTSIEELEATDARIKELRLLIGRFKYPTPAEYREALEALRREPAP